MSYSQTYEHELQPVKGWHSHSLDKVVKLDSTISYPNMQFPAGRVGVLSNNGTLVLADGANLTSQMPLFIWNSNVDPDVVGWPGTGVISFQDGRVLVLVATGGYELQTTEYDTSRTYLPNQALTATTDADGIGGLLTNNAAVYSNWVCGITSLGCNQGFQTADPTGPVVTNANGISVLTFWTYFLPKYST